MTPAIQQLCVNLYKQGMEPTTSLLRAKSFPKLTLPQAVAAIQWWQQQDKQQLLQDTPTIVKERQPTAESNLTLADVEQRILKLEAELSALKSAVAALKASE